MALHTEKWSWRALKDMVTLMMRRDVVTRSSQSRWWPMRTWAQLIAIATAEVLHIG